LGTGDDDFVRYAREGVEHCNEILAIDPNNATSAMLLRDAEASLEKAIRYDKRRNEHRAA